MRASRSKSADDRPLSRARPHQPQRSPSCTDVPAAFRRACRARRCSSSSPDTADAAFVARERGGEEPRLAQQAFGSGIEFGGGLERRDEQPLEVFDRLPMATERIVEVQHFADERGTQIERRRGAIRDRLVRGGLDQHLALEHGQQPRQGLGPLVQTLIPVAPRQQIGQDDALVGESPA